MMQSAFELDAFAKSQLSPSQFATPIFPGRELVLKVLVHSGTHLARIPIHMNPYVALYTLSPTVCLHTGLQNLGL